jgi:hypothetical protein
VFPAARNRKRWSWVLVCAILAGLSAPALAASHDGRDGPTFCPEDHLAPAHPIEQFENVLPPIDAAHCPICHWLQALRSATPQPVRGASLQPARSVRAVCTNLRLACVAVTPAKPTRAPPSLT